MNASRFAIIAAFCMGSVALATPVEYVTTFTGLGESPPNSSPGTGFADIVLDTALHTLAVSATFSGLLGTTTASHIHCCTTAPLTGTAGVATMTPSFINFPLGVTSGTYSMTFNTLLASTYNGAFVTANGGTAAGAEAALAAGLAAGEAYYNIHTSFAPNGEIRGFLLAAPEPSTFGLAAAALGGLLVLRRRRAS